ncbi:DUF5706 domain-containing protein [Kitasatospora sp. NBC_01266]|nr:Pycsar system effector family protein [Kitasatospora sp. NBC_01266]
MASAAVPALPPMAEKLLADLRQETARADTKGSVLVGVQGTAAAALVGVLTARGWNPGTLSPFGQLLWWAGTVCFLTSMGALLMAVLPRFRAREWRPGMPLTHFADIRRAAALGPTALAEALRKTEREPEAALLAALIDNSRIVTGKYWWLRGGMACFMGALVLLPGALLAG